MRDGKRCRDGDHRLDPVSDSGVSSEASTAHRGSETGQNLELNRVSVKDFLTNMIRTEMICAMAEMFPKTLSAVTPAMTPLILPVVTPAVTQIIPQVTQVQAP